MSQLPAGYRTEALSLVENVDLSGKVAIVTGGTSGLGVETVRALAQGKAHVIIACRDAKRGENTRQDVIKSTGNSKVDVMQLDLDSLQSVRDFAKNFIARNLPLHILINNAAIMACPYTKTADGFEAQFGTNHLAHFLLTMLLLPVLKASKPARVVVVSSVAAKKAGVHFDDIQWEKAYDKWGAYCSAKSANAMFAYHFNRLYAKEGVTCNGLHPGGIMTGLQKSLPLEEMQAMGWCDKDGKVHEIFKTVSQGAATSVFAAVSPSLEGVGGVWLEDCAIIEPVNDRPGPPNSGHGPWCLDEENQKKLWDLSLKLVGLDA